MRTARRISISIAMACFGMAACPIAGWCQPHSDSTAQSAPLIDGLITSPSYESDSAKALPALVDGLKSPEVNIRRKAAFALGEFGPEAASTVGPLSNALRHDADIEVRTNAAFALGEIGGKAIPVLLAELGNQDPRIRRSIASALVQIGKPAVPRLIDLLTHPDPIQRRNAAGILGRMGPKATAAVPALERAVDDQDSSFSWTARQALLKINNQDMQDQISTVTDQAPHVRRDAPGAAELQGEAAADAVADLIACLDDRSAKVRKKAAFALARIGPPALPALMEALDSSSEQTRKNAAFSLGEMGSAAAPALPALKELLNDRSNTVRWCADNAITKISLPRD